ncbi:MAG: hypothetical protein LBR05_08330 [Azoarcus sp.]|jgi:hypothetical protein|nr:hypothetical protein [Azoarcus sp.]
MARAVGIEPAAPDVEAALKGDALVVLDELAAPARHLDLAAWRAALVGLENGWFAPIVAALRDGRLREFRLVAPGDRCRLALELGSCARRCFWRRPLFPDDLPLPEPR